MRSRAVESPPILRRHRGRAVDRDAGEIVLFSVTSGARRAPYSFVEQAAPRAHVPYDCWWMILADDSEFQEVSVTALPAVSVPVSYTHLTLPTTPYV